LQFGLVVFGLGSLASAFASSADQLIATRAFMGIGGAFIMPATLSIITNVFPANERGKAIGVWAGTAGLAGVLGPTTGGFLLEHFYWGSIFLVNIPIVVLGLLAGLFVIPTSKDPDAGRLDPVGALLSIIGLVALLYGIIEAPSQGWTDPPILAAFVFAVVALGGFVAWEAHTDHPMLDVRFFKNPRFTAASASISLIFFAMFGSTFLITQYFQFVLGYSPLETGVRFLPLAICILIGSPLSAPFAHRVGTKVVVTLGLSLATLGLLSFATLSVDSSYWPDVLWRMVLLASGMALTMAPATESIMGSLPLGKAGVGSAVNDTTRQVGGALGVAVIGSVLSSIYASQMGDYLAGKPVSSGSVAQIKESLGAALGYADRISGRAPEVAQSLSDAASAAYVDGLHAAVIVAAAATLIGVVVVAIWLPARALAEVNQRSAFEGHEVDQLLDGSHQG
jgi:EmrB/QacA subfamily drug resistance transporter